MSSDLALLDVAVPARLREIPTPAQRDEYAIGILEAAIEALSDASDVFRYGEIVRGVAALTKTLDVFEASVQTTRRAYECLLIALRGLGGAIDAEYSRALQAGQVAKATGIRRSDVSRARRLSEIAEDVFHRSLELLRSRGRSATWGAFLDAVAETTDPAAYHAASVRRAADDMVGETMTAISQATDDFGEMALVLGNLAHAAQSLSESPTVYRWNGERAASDAQTFRAASEIAGVLRQRFDARAKLPALLKAVDELGRQAARFIDQRTTASADLIAETRQMARELLVELRRLERALEKLVIE